MGPRPVILTRDSGGRLHALFNRCAHRASTVCQSECGSARRLRRITTLWSRPPYERPMMTVVDDPVGVHFAWNGGRCSVGVYGIRGGIESGHRTCQGNLEEAVRPWGVDPDTARCTG